MNAIILALTLSLVQPIPIQSIIDVDNLRHIKYEVQPKKTTHLSIAQKIDSDISMHREVERSV